MNGVSLLNAIKYNSSQKEPMHFYFLGGFLSRDFQAIFHRNNEYCFIVANMKSPFQKKSDFIFLIYCITL